MSPAVSESTAGFPPLASPAARVLILGTLPSQKSLALNQYYGHPQNAFWRIMGVLFDAGREFPYEERVARITARRIAVWDVLAASVRPGSLDADIDVSAAVANDFTAFYARHPAIELVCFNGQMASKLYSRLVAPGMENRSNRRHQTLPSTSPAHAAMTFETKLEHWQVVRDVADAQQGE